MLSIMLFSLSSTLIFFLASFGCNRFIENEFAKLICNRGFIIIGLYSMTLNAAIAATIADNLSISLTNEMFSYMFIFGILGYLGIVVMILKTFIDFKALYLDKRERRRFGDED